MVMAHAKPYPCCDVRRGRCANESRRDYYQFKAFMWAEGWVFALFGFRAARRFTDWYFRIVRPA